MITVSDDYTGSLDGRLHAQTFSAGDARVTKISVGEMDNNAYLIESVRDGEALLVDAADDADALVDFLKGRSTGLRKVLTTHWHPDHWQALNRVLDEFSPTSVASPGDSEHIESTIDSTVSHGDTVEVGTVRLEVIGLRGHTADSLALLLRTPDGGHLFSADSLFPGGPGKTWESSHFDLLMDDLESRVFGVLGDSTVVHPGHGDDTTIGAERPKLSEWRARGW